MISKVIVRPEAEADLGGAYRWYEERCPGLGSDFLLSFEASLFAIQRYPEAYPIVHKQVRRALIRRFPYGVFYINEEKRIAIIAVMHAGRNPVKWKQRSKLSLARMP